METSFFQTYINPVLLIIAVVFLFNLMIFVHELGHFWAARWRGLYVDRFQIWFGKPLWKKKINGVEWGLGWIPAGGFVSIPQLAPMESIEGEVDAEGIKEYLEKSGKDSSKAVLPGIKPLDKIIVAFAGPLFSFLLALSFGVAVWVGGKSDDRLVTTTVGYIMPGTPAAESGLCPGDRILAVDGQPVTEWVGNMEGVLERIMLSENPRISFTVERSGEMQPLVVETSYRIPEKAWWQRRAMRQVGFSYASRAIVGSVLPGSPAEKAGLKPGDVLTTVNGEKIWSREALTDEAQKGNTLAITVTREGQESPLRIDIKPELPLNADRIPDAKPGLGIAWNLFDEEIMKKGRDYPTPFAQVTKSLSWMKITLQKIASPGSDVGVQHLAGPVGIGTQFYNLLRSPDGWMDALWFAVVLNVNLAVLNMLPLPVVDGGHVVLGFAEMIRRRPVSGKPLEFVQTAFVVLMLLFFLFVTSKDIGDLFGRGKPKEIEPSWTAGES